MKVDGQSRTFISYSRINQEFALKLARELRASKFAVWLDQLDIPTGARWDNELEKALNECEIFLVILTPASITSENVKDEIGFAIDHGKHILPVLLDECEIPLRLRRLQYVDFTKKKFSEGIESAKKLLQGLVDGKSSSVSAKEEEGDSKTAPKKKKGDSMPAKKKTGNRATSSSGDVITVSNQGSGNAIAAGRGAQASVSTVQESSDIGAWRKQMEKSIDALKDLLPDDKTDLKESVSKVAEEVSKGEKADAGRIERLVNMLAGMSADIFDVAVTTLANPLAGLGLVIKKVGDKARLEMK
jgi:hypothetical protein